MEIIIQLISGMVGGNLAGMAMKNLSLGTLGNSIAGLVGGGVGGQILTQVLGIGAGEGGMDMTAIAAQIGGGGIGGAIVLAIVGMIKKAMAKA